MKDVNFHLKVKKVDSFQVSVAMRVKSSMGDLLKDQTGLGLYDFEAVEVLLSAADLLQQLLIAVSIICNWVFL
jgi:hypothetical protein